MAIAAEYRSRQLHQLAVMVRFTKSIYLLDSLKTHDWVRIARGCNEPGYAADNWDVRKSSGAPHGTPPGNIKLSPNPHSGGGLTVDSGCRTAAQREKAQREKENIASC